MLPTAETAVPHWFSRRTLSRAVSPVGLKESAETILLALLRTLYSGRMPTIRPTLTHPVRTGGSLPKHHYKNDEPRDASARSAESRR